MFFRRLLCVLMLSLASLPVIAGEAPESVIGRFNEHLLEIMQNAKPLGYTGRQKIMTSAVAETYDIPAMTRSILGSASNNLPPDDLGRIVDAFGRFTVSTYAAQFDGFDGERFDVSPSRPSAKGLTMVPTKLVPRSGDPVEIDYLMREDKDAWRIVDVLLDGTVSQVAMRRSEFNTTFRNSGAEGLVSLMNDKVAALEKAAVPEGE